MQLWNKYRNPELNPAMTAESVSSFQLFLCGLFAGTFSKSVCHPLDVVKKRFQVRILKLLHIGSLSIHAFYILAGDTLFKLVLELSESFQHSVNSSVH